MKTVYIETSIVSYLTARPARDLLAAAWQNATNRWWETRRQLFELFTSQPKRATRTRHDGVSMPSPGYRTSQCLTPSAILPPYCRMRAPCLTKRQMMRCMLRSALTTVSTIFLRGIVDTLTTPKPNR